MPVRKRARKRERLKPSEQAPQRAGASPAWGALLAALALWGVAFALYRGTLANPLVFDDASLADPSLVKPGGLRLRWLSDATFAWIEVLSGGSWYWQRVVNVALHAASATALFGFLRRLYAVVLPEQRSSWLAFYGALLFLVHPVAVYGVAYLVERSIVLATLFSLLSLRCVLEGRVRGSGAWLAGAAFAYVLAVSSKEHALPLPACAAALIWLLRGHSAATLRGLAALGAAFALVGIGTVFLARSLIGTAYEPFAAEAGTAVLGPGQAYLLSAITQGWLFFQYLLVWIVPWPGWMSIDLRVASPAAALAWPQLGGFVTWVAYPIVAALLMRRGGRAGLAGFGLMFPWLLALTEMAVVRFQEPFVLYRSYLWMAGFWAVLPALLLRISPTPRHALAAGLCGALAAVTLARLATFASPYALWDDVVAKNRDARVPLVERGYFNRGMARFDRGEREAALADFERALEFNQRYPDAWLGRASLHLTGGRPTEALADLDRALALDPNYAAALDKRCLARAELGDPAAALADCRRALEIAPRNVEALVNIGAVYYRLGRTREAEDSYQRALRLDPAHGYAHHNLGVLQLDSGRRDEAVREHFVSGCNAGVAASCDVLRRSRRAP